MTTTIKILKRMFGLEPRISREQAMAAFGRRYASFNELLQSNADLAAILAKLDAAQRGDKHLETHQVRRIARKAVFHCERMAACLNDMSRNRYKDLEKSVAAIGQHIENELEKHTRGDVNALILPLTEVDASMGYSVGYHYAILDSWCGETLSKNYIRFEFAGGAAGSVQRERRVRCIGVILTELGFTVEIVGDRIRARYQKYPRLDVLSRLDQLGRLLIMTRQMDMLMTSDAAVHGYAMKFLNGEYH